MLPVLLQTLPFFALIGLGYAAGRTGFFTDEATAWLTKFVFYFALSAMLFRFSASLSLGEVLDWTFVAAYLVPTVAVYLLATAVALWRKVPAHELAAKWVESWQAVPPRPVFIGIDPGATGAIGVVSGMPWPTSSAHRISSPCRPM